MTDREPVQKAKKSFSMENNDAKMKPVKKKRKKNKSKLWLHPPKKRKVESGVHDPYDFEAPDPFTSDRSETKRMASSYSSSPRHVNEYEFDDNDSLDLEDEKEYGWQVSDEDTEDASETDMVKQEEEFTEIKEQMYQDKLAQLKKQLNQLKEGTLPEYMKKLKKIDQMYKERIRVNEIWYNYELDCVEKDYVKEKKSSAKEFEEKKIDLKENIIAELEDKKRTVDGERCTIDIISGDITEVKVVNKRNLRRRPYEPMPVPRKRRYPSPNTMEIKPIMTRKLRRRPNDPNAVPIPEKRRKPSPAALNFCLDDFDILEDLRIINKVSGKPISRKPQSPATSAITHSSDHLYDARIDDGRLYYDKKWFHRGQQVMVESKETGKVNAVITAVGPQEVWLRKQSDNSKLRVYVSQLQKGKYSIKRKLS